MEIYSQKFCIPEKTLFDKKDSFSTFAMQHFARIMV